jgi:hypothetical protein
MTKKKYVNNLGEIFDNAMKKQGFKSIPAGPLSLKRLDAEWKNEIVKKLSEIFQEILLEQPKPGDEFDNDALDERISKFVIPAKKDAIAKYQRQRTLDFHAVR